MTNFRLTHGKINGSINYDQKRTNRKDVRKMNQNVQITGKVTLAEVRAIAGMTQEKFDNKKRIKISD